MKINSIRRMLALLLAVVVIIMSGTVTVFAVDTEAESGEGEEGVIHAEFNPDDWMTAGNAVYDTVNSRFTLTTLHTSISGAVWYNYAYEEDFTLELDYYIGDGEGDSYGGADGMVISFYANFDYSISTGGSLGYSSNFGGYGIELDTYNGNENDPSYNHIALIQGSTSNHIVNARLDEAEDKSYHHLKIDVKENNLTVFVDDVEKFTYSNINRTGKGWIGISAATGGGVNNHAVKNIEITGKRSSNEKFFDVALSHNISNHNTTEDKLNGIYEYEIIAEVSNNAPATANGVKTTITLDENLTLLSDATVNVGDVAGKQTKTAVWKVSAPWPLEDIEAHYSTETTISGISMKFYHENNLLIERKNVISFDANGGSGEMSSYGVSDGEIEFPACEFVAPEGYGFFGWATSANGAKIEDDKLFISNEDITLYPIWEKIYDVHLNANNGIDDPKTITVFEGSALPGCDFTEPATMMFKGWSLSPDGETLDSSYRVNAETTLYAVWEKYYTVSIGGSSSTGGYYRYFEGVAELPECSITAPEGYEFAGWSTSEDGEIIDGGKIEISDNITIYPIWVKVYTVSFDANGGAGEMAPITLRGGTHSNIPCNFVAPDGKMFVGWSLTSDGEALESVEISEDMTLYAIWKDCYTVSFDANGGSGSMSSVNILLEQSFALPECKFIAPDRHIFIGWALSPEGEVVESISAEDVTLYAIWDAIYNITFDANGGTGEMQPIVDLREGKILMPTCTFRAPDGFRIKGWAFTPDGDVIEGEMLDVNGDITLYAIWEEAPDFENPILVGVETYLEGVLGIDITKELLLFVAVAILVAAGFVWLCVITYRKYF